jgi:hypothetical protein
MGGGGMVPQKYAFLGFDIAKFGAHSKALRFNFKPIFVFSSDAKIDVQFMEQICDTYLKISEKRKDLTCIKS